MIILLTRPPVFSDGSFFLPPMLFTLNYPYYSPVNTSSLLTLQKLKKEEKKKLTKVAVFLLDLDRIVLEALDELEGCLCLLSWLRSFTRATGDRLNDGDSDSRFSRPLPSAASFEDAEWDLKSRILSSSQKYEKWKLLIQFQIF